MDTPYDKLLVLDLDETLIHTVESYGIETEFQGFEIRDGYYVNERPGVREFLERCFDRFEDVAVWTAGTRDYAMEILPRLCDVNNFAFVWGRERCTWHRNLDVNSAYVDSWRSEHWLKDISKIKRLGYAKEKILFVDDTAANFKRSYGNLVQVRPFEAIDLQDDELELLAEYLDELGPVTNVRTFDKRNWRSDVRLNRLDGAVELP